jgi:hypothetical protein
MTTPDPRRGPRYPVQLHCEILSPARVFGSLSGVTLNMSRSGMLASFPEAGDSPLMPRVGHVARIVVELPGSSAVARRCVECLGHVVRVGQEADASGVAFEFRRFRFCTRDSADTSAWMPFPGALEEEPQLG